MVDQPRRQIYSAPNQQRLVTAPSTQGMRQASREAETGGRILDSLGAIGQMRQQQVNQQQAEIDTRDKHMAVSRRMRHLPEIQNAIKEANLEGEQPEKILDFVKGLDSYHNIFAEIDNPETKQQLYQGLNDELWGDATNKQYLKLEMDRRNLSVDALAGTIELNRENPEALKASMETLKSEFTDPEGYYKFSEEEYEQLIVGHLEARVRGGEYGLASQLDSMIDAKTELGVNAVTQLRGSISAGLEKERVARVKQAYTEQGDGLILEPSTTARDIETHVQAGIQNSLFSDGVDADKYRQYMLKKLKGGIASMNVLPALMNGSIQSRDQLRHYVQETGVLKGVKDGEREQIERQATQEFFTAAQERLIEAYGSENPAEIAEAQDMLARSIRMRPIEVQNQLIGLATTVLPPDADPNDGLIGGASGALLLPQDGQPAAWDTWVQAYGGNEFAMIQDQLKDPTQQARLQDMAVFTRAFGSREKGLRMATDHQYRDKLARDPSHSAAAIDELVTEFTEDFPPQMISEYRQLISKYSMLPLKTADEAARGILKAKAGELDDGVFTFGRPVYGNSAGQLQDVMNDVLTEAIGVPDPKTGMPSLRPEDSPQAVMDKFLKDRLSIHNIQFATDYDPDDLTIMVQPTGVISVLDKTGLPVGGRSYALDDIINFGVERRSRLNAQAKQDLEDREAADSLRTPVKPEAELSPLDSLRQSRMLGTRHLLKE